MHCESNRKGKKRRAQRTNGEACCHGDGDRPCETRTGWIVDVSGRVCVCVCASLAAAGAFQRDIGQALFRLSSALSTTRQRFQIVFRYGPLWKKSCGLLFRWKKERNNETCALSTKANPNICEVQSLHRTITSTSCPGFCVSSNWPVGINF